MPPMLPLRPWPQTLLLTALAVLIVAATIMLACGPAAQQSPAAEPDTRTAADPEAPTAAPPPPTSVPTVCVQWESTEERIEYCFTPEPETTPKYPNLSDHRLVELVEEFEKAQQSARGATGQSAEQNPSLIEVRIELLSSDKVDGLAAWLESQGVSGIDKGEVDIHTWLPVSLLGPMSEQDGVRNVRIPPEPVPTVIW